MPEFPCASAFVLLIASFAAAVNAQTEMNFPTDNEINLVLTQTDRAVQQYKPLIDQEAQLGKGGADASAKDREVLFSLEMAVSAFRRKPSAFNGPLGFAFFEWLDDASRNALLCANFASTQVAVQVIDGNSQNATSMLRLAQSCTDASTLLYTVSENAGSLYERYSKAEEQLAVKGVEAAERCTDALKKHSTPPKQ
jgi:hypothetical protein